MSSKKVVIIGGGCAGLSAAYTLKKRGVDFVLFEASARVGGRVGNRQWKDFNYAIGAAMTEPQWKTTFKYLNELNLINTVSEVKSQRYAFWNKGKNHYVLLGEGMNPFAVLGFGLRGMPFKTYLQLLKFGKAISPYMKSIGQNGEHNFDGLHEVSNINTAEFGLKHGGAEVVNRILNPFLGTMVLARAQDVSVAHPIALMSLMKGMCRLDGGLSTLNEKLYAEVKENVRISTPVKGVETSEGFVDADQVICAVDAVLARELIPDLPVAMKKPLETCKYSSTYHYVFLLEKRLVPDHFLSLMIPQSENSILSTIFEENSKAWGQRGPEGTGIMHAFTAGWHDKQLTGLSEDERTRIVIKEIQKFFPAFPNKPMYTDCIRFDKAVNLEAPGQFIAIQDLLKNHMRDVKGLYLAGEYLFLIACTEGAWTTGEEAAESVIADI